MLLSVCRVTPRILAPSGYGQAQRLEAIVPDDASGMYGIFHGHVFLLPLVVVDQFNVKGVGSFKAENDAPVGPYGYGPQPFQIAFERVKAIAGEDLRVLRRGGGSRER